MSPLVRSTLIACLLLCFAVLSTAQQSAQDEVLQTTRNWLKDMSTGDRAGLNAIMDPRFIATTPVGDVITKERLVPDDPTQAARCGPALMTKRKLRKRESPSPYSFSLPAWVVLHLIILSNWRNLPVTAIL